MRVLRAYLAVIVLISILTISLLNNAFAIGTWKKGTVTKDPWRETYTYVQIDGIKYTIMKDAKIVNTRSRNNMTFRDKMSTYSIFRGDKLYFAVEGNRIYQIEKIR